MEKNERIIQALFCLIKHSFHIQALYVCMEEKSSTVGKNRQQNN